MKKFTVYEWSIDDEGGFGICLTNKYSDDINSPLFDRTQDKIGEFNTVDELAELLYNYNPEYYNSVSNAYEEDGKRLFDCYCRGN